MTEPFTCEFCNKTFSNKNNLDTHKKTAKYCLKKQGKEIPEKKKFMCDSCNNNFADKRNLEKHKEICASYIRKTEEEKRENLIADIKNHYENQIWKNEQAFSKIQTKTEGEIFKYKQILSNIRNLIENGEEITLSDIEL